MKRLSSLICILGVLLAGCASAARRAPQVLSITDDVLRVARSRGDDLATTSKQYVSSGAVQYSEDALRYWRPVLSASQRVDDAALLLLYREESLTPLQDDFVRWLREDIGLTRQQSLLYMQNVCFVAGVYKEAGEPPSTSYTQQYIELVAAHNDIPISEIQDFAESAIEFVEWVVGNDPTYTRTEAAELLFNGLCLVAEVDG